MKLPTRWQELSIGQYQKAHEVFQTEYEQLIDRHIALVSALSGLPEKKVLELPAQELKDTVAQLSFIHDLSTLSARIPRHILMRGMLFNIQTDLRKLTAGQYIDLTSYTKKGDIIAELHNILAVLTTPVLHKYRGERHAAIAALIHNHMSIATAYPIALFFCDSFKLFTRNIPDFLINQLQQTTTDLMTMKSRLEADLKTATAGS
jgi:hypothetical protein